MSEPEQSLQELTEVVKKQLEIQERALKNSSELVALMKDMIARQGAVGKSVGYMGMVLSILTDKMAQAGTFTQKEHDHITDLMDSAIKEYEQSVKLND